MMHCSLLCSLLWMLPPCVQAVDALVRVQAELVDYSVNSVTGRR